MIQIRGGVARIAAPDEACCVAGRIATGRAMVQQILSATLVAIALLLAAVQSVQAQALTSGVSFVFSDTQSSDTDPATLQSVIVNGQTFSDLVAPTAGYSIANPIDPGRIRIGNAGQTLQDFIDAAGSTAAGIADFEAAAGPLFALRDLNRYVRIDRPNALGGNPPPAGTFTQTLRYAEPIVLQRGGFIVITERGGNNDFAVRAFDGATSLGLATVTRGCSGTTGYFDTGRDYDNGQDICAAVFPMSVFGTSGTFDRVDLVCAALSNGTGSPQDCGDGKIFVVQPDSPFASDDEDLDNTPGAAVSLDILDNDTDSDGTVEQDTVTLIVPTGVTVSNQVTDADGDLVGFEVAGEGAWSYSDATGTLTFTPATGFNADPTVIGYTVDDDAGETSNEANVTVTYAAGPIAVDDSSVGNPAQSDITIDILANDVAADGAAPAPGEVTVDLDPATSGVQTTLSAPGEGVWTYDTGSGALTFDPDPGLVLDPTPIDYVLTETANGGSATATVTVGYLVPASASGVLFLDANGNGSFEPGTDDPRGGYRVELRDGSGTLLDTTTTASDGTYDFVGFPRGADHAITFFDVSGPGAPVSVGRIAGLDFDSTPVQSNIDQPIDPAGVVYGSISRDPIAGVQLQLTDSSGTPLPAACLGAGQQPQTTGPSGAYDFAIQPGAAAACPTSATEYLVEIVSFPPGFLAPPSSELPPESGPLVAGTCPIDAVPGGACQVSASGTPPPPGTTAPYYFSFVIGAGDPDVVNNHIPLDPTSVAAGSGLSITKTASVDTVVLGDVVAYDIVVDNPTSGPVGPVEVIDRLPDGLAYLPGSAAIDGVDSEPDVAGQVLTFPGLTAPARSTAEVTLSARVTGSAPVGELVNLADLVDPATGQRLASTARATVYRQPEHIFDCSDVIGKVFDDRDLDGSQDGPSAGAASTPGARGGEPGLPGVRVVTPRGTIITTDRHGRFHVPCAELPGAIGTNFTLKVDTRSLPTGYRMTTENPRTVRLTAGKMAKINFGAAIGRVIDVDLSARAFDAAGRPVDALSAAVAGLLVRIADEPSMLRLSYYARGEDRAQIRRRLDAVEEIVRDRWRQVGRYKLNVERTIKRVQ